MTKEQAEQEIDEICEIYRKTFGGSNHGFLVGTSLGKTKHKFGDSGRIHELMEIINKK